MRLALVQADGGDRRHRESYTRHPPIIRLMTVALQNVGSDDLAVVTGYGRQGRPRACTSASRIQGFFELRPDRRHTRATLVRVLSADL